MTKDLDIWVFQADDWLLRSSESLAIAASEEHVRFTSTLTVNKHLIWLRQDDNEPVNLKQTERKPANAAA